MKKKNRKNRTESMKMEKTGNGPKAHCSLFMYREMVHYDII